MFISTTIDLCMFKIISHTLEASCPSPLLWQMKAQTMSMKYAPLSSGKRNLLDVLDYTSNLYWQWILQHSIVLYTSWKTFVI